ncbi:MAG: ABC transporter ATP-binding protein [Tissierellia bacterium]|nr:ABC transporter ATP-binding protein [Tissierellia bacterium]
MIELMNISKTYSNRFRANKKLVLDHINFLLESEEILALMGPSGCGKTTIARLILGLEKADSGSIVYNSVDLSKLNKKEFKPYRKDIQLISQKPSSFFDPSIKLGKSIIEPLKNFNIILKDKENRIEELLNDLKLDNTILKRYPHQVSGGEIQRLSILRALLLEPKILILDEATSMLDISVQAQILYLLKEIKNKNNMSYLFISHDKEVVNLFADRVIKLKEGKIYD